MTKEQKQIAKETIKQVNKYFDTDCRVKSRKINIVRPRMYACKIIRELTGVTLQDIADLFGLTHGSIVHALKIVDNDFDVMPKYKSYYLELRAIIESTSVYKSNGMSKNDIISDVKVEIYSVLMGKDMKELQQILKTIR